MTDGITQEDVDLQKAFNDESERRPGIIGAGNAAIAAQNDVVNKNSHLLDENAKAARSASDAFSKLISFVPAFSDMSTFIDMASSKLASFSNITDSTKQMFAESTRTLMTFTGMLPVSTDLFGRMGDVGKNAGMSIAHSFGTIAPILEKLGLTGLTAGLKQVAAAADQIQTLQLSMYKAAAASGQLDQFIGAVGDSFDGLTDAATTYNKQLYLTAVANRTGIDTAAAFAENLRMIPGAMQKSIPVAGAVNGEINLLSAGLKVASAYMLDHKEVTDVMTEAYRNFGTTGDQSIALVARLGAVTQDLGMPFDLVRQSTMRTAETFKMFGDNTQAAINILQAFGPALKDSGLGPAGINELVGSMTQGIARMDIAKKAFVSGMSGGPGGLAGAFELDKLMQKGNMDEVLNRTMKAMQNQFGGPVVTLQDVTQTPALSAEFLKQISYLKDVAGIAQSDQEAERILDAMKRGSSGTLQGLAGAKEKTKEDVLSQAVERGNKIQDQIEKNTGQLLKLQQMTQRQQQMAAEGSLQQTRQILGGRPGEIGDKAATAAREASNIGAGMAPLKEGMTPVSYEAEQLRSVDELKELKDLGKNVGRNVLESDVMKTFASFMKSALPNASAKQLGALGEQFGLQNEVKNWSALKPEQQMAAIKNKLSSMFGAGEFQTTTTAGRTTDMPTAQSELAAPHEMRAALAAGRRVVPGGAKTAAPEQTIKVEVVLKDDHFKEIGRGEAITVISAMNAGSLGGKGLPQ